MSIESQRGDSRRASLKRMLFAGQGFWYVLTVLIFLGSVLLGLGIAYLITRMLVEMNLSK